MARKLIINADDFGLTNEINESIMECYASGIVTDISCLATGDAFENAVTLARKSTVDAIGVHLCLTGAGKPVAAPGDVKSLLCNGRFPKTYISFLMRYFTGRVKTDEIYIELKNQIAKVKRAGFQVTHIDSHHHIHVVPGILKLVIQLMREERIENIRFPREKIPWLTGIRNPRAWARNMALLFMCTVSGATLEASRARHSDSFIGHAFAHKMHKDRLVTSLRGVKDGLTELACHPGACEEERKLLCDTVLIAAIYKSTIELNSY
jgi:predicted glycoside hydrolase/deacetylase ChbG (UPF0249 family)